jgi:mannan endo-1,4-beta-mannosidase
VKQGVYARWRLYISLGLITLILLALASVWFFWGPISPMPATKNPKHTQVAAFVTRSGPYLMLGGKIFRFAGANIYWLGLQENPSVSYPSHFEVDDALATASFMGATVVRSHTLGISTGCSLCVEPSLNQFNQTALQHIDYAIESARLHHIKLIIPLTDNWHYYHGGKHNFTDWRGLSDENQFYYNSLVMSDFKHYISVILNHVNIYNGIAYKNDPTILAWETGNELSAPSSWVQSIASYIKSIDHHHLVMDGNAESVGRFSNFLTDLSIPKVDIYTGHYYPPDIFSFQTQLNQANYARKVFIVGEYDWNTNNGSELSDFLSAIQYSSAAGDMYWTLFPHTDLYGYVQHGEHYTLHYPGDTPDMRRRVSLLRAHAYAMQGQPVSTSKSPGTPQITFVTNNAIAWRGAAGADTYMVERSTVSSDGPWTVICDRCATDDDTPWLDTSRPAGSVWYRVRAYSVSGIAGPYSDSFFSPE